MLAGADEKAQARLAEHRDAGGVGPVGLADDTHLVAMRIEHAADDGHAKARMVHVGIAADVDKVALVPATCIHVGAADGEELIAARAPGACERCWGMRGVPTLRLTAALLLLALFALLTALVVLSVLRLFATIPPGVCMLHVIVTSLFGTGLKRLVEYMGWRIGVSMRVSAPRPPLFPDCVSARGEPVSRACHVVNGLQYERRLCFRQRTRESSTRRMHDDAACQTDIGVY